MNSINMGNSCVDNSQDDGTDTSTNNPPTIDKGSVRPDNYQPACRSPSSGQTLTPPTPPSAAVLKTGDVKPPRENGFSCSSNHHKECSDNKTPNDDSMLELQKSFVKQASLGERRLYKFCGLVNLGNTCYANSCLQILYNLRRIRKTFIERKNVGLFHHLIGTLFESMLTVNQSKSDRYGYFEPSEFMKEFRKRRSEFIHDEQHDAQEFMTVLLDILHQETNKVDADKSQMVEAKNQAESWNNYVRFIDNSHLSKNFLGQAESVVTCQVCKNNSLSWYCFWQLTLHISATTLTLDDCFKEFRDTETLEEDSSPICTKCNKKQPSTKTQYICRSPHYLFCHLKRFTYDGQKIYSKIEIPDEIAVGRKQYKFHGAVLHSGFMQAGHYTAIIAINDELFLHDDDDVIQMNDKNESYMRRKLDYDAYMVFYKSVANLPPDH